MSESTSNPRRVWAWLAPLLSTVVTLPTMVLCFAMVGLSPMACDSCSEAENAAFAPSFRIGFRVFLFGLLLPLGLVVTSWVLPRTPRHAKPRAVLAVSAPLAVLLLVAVFAAIVVWP